MEVATEATEQRKMKINEPTVTVIVTTKNRPNLLLTALESLQKQSFEDWECWVLNDAGGSLWEEATAIHHRRRVAVLTRDERIQVLRLTRSVGPYPARNIGLRLARGKYVTYLDDDDWLDPNHFARLVARLDAGADVVYSDSRRVFEDKLSDGTWKRGRVQEPYHARDFDRQALLVDNFIPILALMHRRDCVDETGLFDESLPVLGDWEMWLRMSERYRFERVPGITCSVRYRNDHSSITTGRRQHHYDVVRTIYDRYQAPPELFVPRARILSAFAKEHARLSDQAKERVYGA